MKLKQQVSFLFLLFTILTISITTYGEKELSGEFFTLKEENSQKIITETAHWVVQGDRYLTEANQLYQVEKTKGRTAFVKLIQQEKKVNLGLTNLTNIISGLFRFDFLRGESNSQKGLVGIYHTHTDESYQPSDGAASQRGNGGIIKVGDSLAKALKKQGVPVEHIETPHDPHDAMAYDRSRRTAAKLIKKQPSCLIDVHRDAVPPERYTGYVNNQKVTKIQLVVGRQNPNFEATNKFAKQIKAKVDAKYPGLIKGIFYGKGKYNQDLGPRTIILEFGTDKNLREDAEKAAGLFAAAASGVLSRGEGKGSLGRSSLRNLFWILAIVVGGVILFLIINRSNLSDITKEFTGAVGETNKDSEKKSDSEKESQQKTE